MTTTAASACELFMTRTFDAAPERVFDAWLSKSIDQWMGPQTIRAEAEFLEPRPGGRYRIIMHRQDGSTIAVSGIYRTIERPSRLVFTWKWDPEEQETLVTLTFRRVGTQTEMTLRHENFANTERRDSHNAGWASTFDKLAAYLAKASS